MRSLTCLALLTFVLIAVSPAQQASTTAVPNLINYSGTLLLPSGVGVPAKTVGVTFAIYRQQDGGAPVWLETQNVTLDSAGVLRKNLVGIVSGSNFSNLFRAGFSALSLV